MERKLASIQRIAEIKLIENADAIEAVRVNGWWVVAKKNQFKIGDLCVYFEIDSILPIHPEFEFLRKSCYRKADWIKNGEGFRLKTVRLRKQLSQGLVLPISVLGSFMPDWCLTTHQEGDDVTDFIGVTKWDPPLRATLGGLARGYFPSFIPKTDQERVQNIYSEIFSEPNFSALWEVTTKLDGSSCTIFSINGELRVCSRNLELSMDQEGNAFVDTVKRLFMADGENQLVKIGLENVALQGELMGPGIQGNPESLSSLEFFLYDMWDIESKCYVLPSYRVLICDKLGIQHVPILYPVTTFSQLNIKNADDLLLFTEGPSLNNPIREGTVWKRSDGEFSFKVISNSFLEKED